MALDFAGASANHNVNVGTLGDAALTPALTVALWACADTSVNTKPFFSTSASSTSGAGLGLRCVNTNALRFLYNTTAGGIYMARTSANGAYTAGAWHFFAFTFDDAAGSAAANKAHIFVGSLTATVAEVAYSSANEPAGTPADMATSNKFFGHNGFGSGDDFNGKIAAAWVFDSALTLAELRALQFRRRIPTRPLGYWEFGFAGTASQPDLSGRGHAGTVTGATVAPHVPLGPLFGYDETAAPRRLFIDPTNQIIRNILHSAA